MGNNLRGAGGGGSKTPRAPIEAPDSLRSIAYARILDMVSEGEIEGFANPDNPLSCVYLNETPVANADGSLNFSNIQIDFRTGSQTQDYLRGFDSVENEISVVLELTKAIPWTQSLTNLNLSAIRVRLSTPMLSRTDLTNGDVKGARIAYRILIATDGGAFVTVFNGAMVGKTSSKYERTHRVDLPPANTGWVIKVERTTLESAASHIQDTLIMESFAEIIDAKLRMPMTAVLGMIVDAEQFNNIPSRAYHLKGRIIQVPTNYDPDTRSYTGIWDGTFQSRYSTNPAWVFYDMVTNPRYGLGHLVPAALVDKWNLYKIAKYCDVLVSDGMGGLEPRFTANLYLQSANDATRVIQDMASIFRGMTYAMGGSVAAVADMPEDPIYTYNPSNVIDGKFTYSGSGRKVRHTVALVSWNDMTDFGRAKVEYIDDPLGIARYGIRQTEVIAVGCTSRGQARRQGKHILTTERYETDSVSFSVGLDGMLPAPGKIINVCDPLRAGRRTGGRIRIASLSSVMVDSIPIVAAGDTLSVILPTGVAQKRTVSSVVGNSINVTPDFDAVPVPQSVWAIESTELATQRFRVLSIKENDGDTLGYSIAAIQHVEGKYDYIEDGTMIVEPPVSVLSVPGAPVVTLTTFMRFGHGVAFNVINADWPDVPGAVEYDIQWRKDDGSWSAPRRKSSSNDEWEGAFAGTYIAQVWAYNARGIPGEATVSDPITVADAVMPIIDLVSVGGVLTIDCRYQQFRLNLTENVTSVVFINVAPQDTLLIEVTQGAPGSHTLAFGPGVVSVSGVPYVVTPTVGAVDILGLTTNNSGVTWALVAQQPVSDAGGGEGGDPPVDALVVSISPSPASATSVTDGSTGTAPSVMLTATATGGTPPVTHAWTRGDSGGTNFLIDDPTSATPTLSLPVGVTAANVTQQWRDMIEDAAGVMNQAVVSVNLSRTVELPPGTVVITNQSIMDENYSYKQIMAIAGYRLGSDGVASRLVRSNANPITGEWLAGAGNTADYECRATQLVFGEYPDSGTLNVWQSLATTRQWIVNNDVDGSIKMCSLMIEIRNATTLAVVASAEIELEAWK